MPATLDLFADLDAPTSPVEAEAAAPCEALQASQLPGAASAGARLWRNLEALRTLKAVQAAQRPVSAAERSALLGYTGWGALKEVFRGQRAPSPQLRNGYAALRELMSDTELEAARDGVLNAFYTPAPVIEALYHGAQSLGFSGGRVLDPCTGIGNFIGLLPPALRECSEITALEIDPTSAAIAAALYPSADVRCAAFQRHTLRFGAYDLAVLNPPFGDETICDPNSQGGVLDGLRIHNYFAGRCLHHLRPGGVLAMVVTRRLLDAGDQQFAALTDELADFCGALRLTDATFTDYAGTSVVTDLVFLRRRAGQGRGRPVPRELVTLDGDAGVSLAINRYFVDDPARVTGAMRVGTGAYGRASLHVEGAAATNLCPAMDRVLAQDLAEGGEAAATVPEQGSAASEDDALLALAASIPVGGYLRCDGAIHQRGDDDDNGNPTLRTLTEDSQWTAKSTLGKRRLERLHGLLDLRELAYKLIGLEQEDAADARIEAARAALNACYARFRKRHGYINDPANFSLVRNDPRIECGLEMNYKKAITAAVAKRTGAEVTPSSAEPAALLQGRVYFPPQRINRAASIHDAHGITLSETGGVHLPRLAELLDCDEASARAQLLDVELAFIDPATGALIERSAYLSGNVRAKRAACGSDPAFAANAAALDAVMPEEIPAEGIFASLGALWIPEQVYRDFAEAIGVRDATISYSNALGRVRIVEHGGLEQNAVNLPWANEDYDVAAMFNMLASRKPLIAYDPSEDAYGNKIRVVNAERTKTLRGIEPRIHRFFADWLWSDPERADSLVRVYNDTMNTHAERHFDGTMLQTVGASPLVTLRDSQRAAAWRGIVSPVTLYDQVVGAGKTFTMITSIMERKRMGLSQKPMIAVPNHLIGQWAAAFYQLYPAAQLLVANEADFAKANRRRLMARLATSAPDCIIIGHSSLGFIPVAPDTQHRFFADELSGIVKALDEAEQSGDKQSVRTLINRKKKLETKMERLSERERDDVIDFEQSGIDLLGVDEVHKFKNLAYQTSMQGVTGMGDPEGSQRAWDLYMKAQILIANEGAFQSATGTPISNSAVEMYSLLRLHNRTGLLDRGIDSFDAWAKTFAGIEQRIEYTATGAVKARTVFASFNNVPELMQLYNEFADVVLQDDLNRLYAEQMARLNAEDGGSRSTRFPIPRVAGGGRELDTAEPNAQQRVFMDYLIERSRACEREPGASYRHIDNALWLTHDARKMALDIRLVDPFASGHDDDKVSRCANRVTAYARQWEAERGTQLVFCDLSTPTGGAAARARAGLRRAITAAGLSWTVGREGFRRQWLQIEAQLQRAASEETNTGRMAQRFLDNEAQDVAADCTTGDVGFSVYDALKQALIDRGMAEHEIRFIHDATTTAQREELFELVRAGVVRVLIGSTAKMGEGMNVQDRLVAIHHLDSPWRPSDVAQREGRGVRQGNLLYEADPEGFRLALVAYSTLRTFDAVLWQVLQRKAEMLVQFRKGVRSIEEGEDDAKSYAEFMAVSSGNPAFRRKFELEREIETLTGDRDRIAAQHAAAQRVLAMGDRRRDEAAAYAESMQQVADALDTADMTAQINGESFALDDWESPLQHARAAAERGRLRMPRVFSDSVVEQSRAAAFGKAMLETIERGGAHRSAVTFTINGQSFSVESHAYSSGSIYCVKCGDWPILETTPRVRFPVEDFLSALAPEKLRAFTQRIANGSRQRFDKVCARIEDANKVLRDLRFDGQDQLDACEAEYEEVLGVVNALEQEAAAQRDPHNNPFVMGDYRRRDYLLKNAANDEDQTPRAAASA